MELCALFASIFSEYSVELVAEGDQDSSSKATSKEKWTEARSNAEHQLSEGVEFGHELALHGNGAHYSCQKEEMRNMQVLNPEDS